MSTNTTIITASGLHRQKHIDWHRRRRTHDSTIFYQYERSLAQFTEDNLHSEYVLVNRNTRYLPIRTDADLQCMNVIFNGNR